MNREINHAHLAHTLESNAEFDLQATKDIRKLLIDICRQNGGGHGGSAIGMAPMAVALWKYAMRYNPRNTEWFDRDRFVLSNGHAAMLLYTMLHISGHEHMSIDELKLYGSPKSVDRHTGKWESTICHGHPEIQVPGVEVTTGPLGQGVANAVGLAIASKNLRATFNKPDLKLLDSHIYCITGDGCLQEGVANEAIAIAGHLALDNMTLLYDNNQVTCDGPLDWIVSEDTNAKMKSMGWNVIDVLDGDSSVSSIVKALAQARSHRGQPTFINIRTTIGFGTSTAGTFKSHHGTYSEEDAALYGTAGLSSTHTLSDKTKEYFGEVIDRGNFLEKSWNKKLQEYASAYPEKASALKDRMNGVSEFQNVLDTIEVPDIVQSTRTFNGEVFNKLMDSVPSMIAGGADLWNSNQLGDQSNRIFDRTNAEGRVIRYGIREHAMASISNGIAAYAPGCFIPITATFFMFYLYAAAGVRMGALSGLPVIHIATHDSIGEGQNGPTHQPVELDSLFRTMPNFQYMRPADAEEVLGAWSVALAAKSHPSMISLARDPALTKVSGTNRQMVCKGGYVVSEVNGAQVTLISCGSELQFAIEAAKRLNGKGLSTRVVSMPAIGLFEQQPSDYQDSVLSSSPHIISVEAYVSGIWSRFCTASVAMDSFGYSGAGRENFARFGIDADGI
nr:dihydroxyacetone synthase [Colletotrichum truncatum]KAF6785066.1 dihydroxyacetone synthase [Colletotrichum truncatum]